MTEEVTPEQKEEWQNTLNQWQAVNYGYPDIVKHTGELEYFKSCITTKPQNIKLELNNGNLKLKAGSTVYIPDGFEQDGTTPKFRTYVRTTDSGAYNAPINQPWMLFWLTDNTYLDRREITRCFAGPTEPISTGVAVVWYDTTTNLIKKINNGNIVGYMSFPLGIINGAGSQINSIDQTFNHMGYIGNTIFTLPTIEGKIYTNTNVEQAISISTVQTTDVGNIESDCWLAYNTSLGIRKQRKQFTEYNVFKNRIISNVSEQIWPELVLGEFNIDSSGKISEFNQF